MPRHAPGSTPRARWPTIRASQPQVTRMYSAYLWVKSFHILFVVAWMSSVFYLPRILVNVAEAGDQAAVRERLLLMGRRLYRFGHNMFGLAFVAGLVLWLGHRVVGGFPTMVGSPAGWLHAKLALVVLLVTSAGATSAAGTAPGPSGCCSHEPAAARAPRSRPGWRGSGARC